MPKKYAVQDDEEDRFLDDGRYETGESLNTLADAIEYGKNYMGSSFTIYELKKVKSFKKGWTEE